MPRDRPTRQLLAAIGEVCLDSARLENELRQTLCVLTRSSMPHVVFAGEDLSRLILATRRASKYAYEVRADDEVWEQLQTILRAAELCRTHRNKVVHAVWLPTRVPRRYIAVRSLRNTKADMTKFDIAEDSVWQLEDVLFVSEALRRVSQRLEAWRSRHFNLGYTEPPLPRDWRPDFWTVTNDDQGVGGDAEPDQDEFLSYDEGPTR